MVAPAARSVARVRSKARATVASRSSRKRVLGTARRYCDSGAGLRVTRRAASTSCATMASRTVRVMAQAVSSVVDRGTAPVVGTSRAVFLKPTMPLSAAGMRMEPPVSEPRATNAAPVATDTAAPDEEPPGTRGAPGSVPNRASSAAGVPKCGLTPTPEKANSTMFVRPMSAPPAARRRATAGLSMLAAGASASTVDPAGVGWPAMSNRSFTDTASPASGRRAMPGCTTVVRASSNSVRTKLCWLAGAWAAAMQRSSSARAVVAPSRSAARVAIRSEGMGVLESLGFAGCSSACRVSTHGASA